MGTSASSSCRVWPSTTVVVVVEGVPDVVGVVLFGGTSGVVVDAGPGIAILILAIIAIGLGIMEIGLVIDVGDTKPGNAADVSAVVAGSVVIPLAFPLDSSLLSPDALVASVSFQSSG